MALTLPDIVPTGYAGDATDFLKTKVDRSGAVRLITGSVSVPSGTTVGKIVGLLPINKGAKICYGSAVYTGALGTSVTLSLGYTYYDSATGTSQAAGYAAASSTAAAGGLINLTAVTSMKDTLAGDGWVTATVGGATTGSTGTVTYNILVAYDPSGVTNA